MTGPITCAPSSVGAGAGAELDVVSLLEEPQAVKTPAPETAMSPAAAMATARRVVLRMMTSFV